MVLFVNVVTKCGEVVSFSRGLPAVAKIVVNTERVVVRVKMRTVSWETEVGTGKPLLFVAGTAMVELPTVLLKDQEALAFEDAVPQTDEKVELGRGVG